MLSTSMKNQLLQRLLAVGLILLFSFLLYFNSMKGEFHFDDYVYIINSPQVKNPHLILTDILSHPLKPNRSFVSLSFAVNYAIDGLAYRGYQFVNIIIHALNGFVIYLVAMHFFLKNFDGQIEAFNIYAFLSALLFIAHPLAVNSVCYISQRHGMMATLFYLSSFYCYIKGIECSGQKRINFLFAVCIFFWFAIHCKPMTITLPLMLMIYSFIYKKVKNYIFLFIPICFFFAGYTWWFAESDKLLIEGIASTAGFKTKNLWSIKTHFMTECEVFLQYLKIIIAPFPSLLCADRIFYLTDKFCVSFYLSLTAHFIIILLSFYLFSRGHRCQFFAILWFYIAFLPYLFVPVQDVMVDYKTYLPSVGFFLLAGEYGCRLEKYKNYCSVTCVIVILFLFSLTTTIRIKTFETEINFWTDVINKEGGNKARALNNRGIAWQKKGNHLIAIEDFTRAISLFPIYSIAYANTGDAYLKLNQHEKAIKYYKKYLKLCGGCPDAYARITKVMTIKKSFTEAGKK